MLVTITEQQELKRGKNRMEKPKTPKSLPKWSPGWRAWHQIHDTYEIIDPDKVLQVEQACHCLNRFHEARERVKQDGAYVLDRFQQLKPHPALQIEKDSITLFNRIIRELGLNFDAPAEEYPRTARLYS